MHTVGLLVYQSKIVLVLDSPIEPTSGSPAVVKFSLQLQAKRVVRFLQFSIFYLQNYKKKILAYYCETRTNFEATLIVMVFDLIPLEVNKTLKICLF
jgi:hypothetical protein